MRHPVNKRTDSEGARFKLTSKILPPYLRRTKILEEFIPWLYLKGISTNDFSKCLQHLTGNNTANLPTTTVRRSSPSELQTTRLCSRHLNE